MSRWICLTAMFLFGSVATAQIVYEPEMPQGASDLAIPYYYRSFGYIPLPAPLYPGVGVKVVDRQPVVADACGCYYCIGGTPDKGLMPSSNAMPRYFRKSDLLDSARLIDGTIVVPAIPSRQPTGGPESQMRPVPPTTRPASTPAPIIIIPKPPERPRVPSHQVVQAQ